MLICTGLQKYPGLTLNIQLLKVIKSNCNTYDTFQSLSAIELIKYGRPTLVACSTGTKVACVALPMSLNAATCNKAKADPVTSIEISKNKPVSPTSTGCFCN